LNANTSSPAIQETSSAVYHVIEGQGHSIIDEKKYSWERGDTFCIPAWHKYQHFAGPNETVYMYRFDDKPMLKALGFYRTAGIDVESLVLK
jgi:gentisate 1,2-dioxygenase